MEQKEKDFLSVLADVLEVPGISPQDDYRSTFLWGSLTCFSLKVTLSQRYGVDLSLKELDSFTDVQSLMSRVLA